MPDISMCAAKYPVSTECVRHPDSGTEPLCWQWWGDHKPTSERGCRRFLQRLENPTQ